MQSPGWQPTLCVAWCLVWWFANSQKCGYTRHRMSLLRPGVIKQHKPTHQPFLIYPFPWILYLYQAWLSQKQVQGCCCLNCVHCLFSCYRTWWRTSPAVASRPNLRSPISTSVMLLLWNQHGYHKALILAVLEEKKLHTPAGIVFMYIL